MQKSDLDTLAKPAGRSEPKGHRGGKGFRPDIEGLRAVAIGLVLLYHGGVDQLTGGFVGVDVFFVISGFLITGLLIRELESSGRVSLARFYARRAKRLLPATAVVLVFTALLTWLSVSVIDWRTFGADIVSAALYVVNWQLAARSVDYLAEDVGVSPVQHFWSLAVEEQFYIVWPLLLVAIAWWFRRRAGARLRPVMTAGILLIAVPSLAYSIVLTGSNAATAFFVTPTRLWELGIGAFVAIGSGVWPRLPRMAAAVLGWAGLAVIGVSGLALSSATPWPGYHALIPTLGTAAVIVAGFAAGRYGPGVVLSWRPAVWIGGLSYSLYLWHWPLIVCATAYWGELGTKKGMLVMAVSFIPAYLCNRFIENPIRFAPSLSASNRYTLSLGAVFTLIGVVAGLVLALAVPSSAGRPDASQAAGAAVLEEGAGATTGGDGTVASLDGIEWFVPDAPSAPQDVPPAYDLNCQVQADGTEPIACEYGNPDGEYVVVVVGDSKVLQWESAFRQIADEEGWRVVSYTKSACAFSDGVRTYQGDAYTACVEWNQAVLAEIQALAPDLVLTSQGARNALEDPDDPSSSSSQAMVDGLVSRWQTLLDQSINVAVLLDNPMPGMSAVYECVAENHDDLAACTFDREAGVDKSAAPVQLAAARSLPEVGVIDLTDVVCPEGQCVPVIGNVLVYRQGSHITDTYVITAASAVREQLVGLAGTTGSDDATPTGAGAPDDEAVGAAAIFDGGAPSGGDGSLASLENVTWYVPEAANATEDMPDAYELGCQVQGQNTEAVACEYGDPSGDIVVAIVGDSKMVQWVSAIDTVADEQGWRVLSFTKSACPFADAARAFRDRVFQACVEWNNNVLTALDELGPDLVITSQGTKRAIPDLDDPATETPEAMVDGLVRRWNALLDDGIAVVVLLDNPQPNSATVYECVAENPDDLASCSFPRDRGAEISAAPVLLAAAEQVPEVSVIDLTPAICPDERCVPVIGNVLVYRQGSHITDTYARTVAPFLAERLIPTIAGA